MPDSAFVHDATGLDEHASLIDLLDRRAEEQAGDRAYVFLSSGGEAECVLSFAALRHCVRRLGGALAAQARPGDRVLLALPTGPECVVGFLACMAARLLPTMIRPPRRQAGRDAALAIAADCKPALVLCAADQEREMAAALAGDGTVCRPISMASIEALPEASPPAPPSREDLAFLQYTAGSTAEPRGVMVSHANLLANLAMLRQAFGNDRRSTHVSWLPLYHDMGLILNVLQAVSLGATCVLMTPAAFMHRPLSWLRAISVWRAEVAAAPNFAYDLCVDRLRGEQMRGIDLSCWKVACNGAEPIRAATLRRFAEAFAPYGFDARALHAGYGMAEATVFAASGRRGAGATIHRASQGALRGGRITEPESEADIVELVGCGRPTLEGSIAIVDAQTMTRLQPGRVGEIWISGPHVARGYWRRAAQTEATFTARIAGEDAAWLRTGDLGCILPMGELIVGRIKEVIIIRGANHLPHDIEATAAASHPMLARDRGAAFGHVDATGEERLVVVQEVARDARDAAAVPRIVAAIREAVVLEHEIAVHRVALVRPGSLPRTTSGKIQRRRARELWLAGALEPWPGGPA